jgi:hypothetical protein
VQAALRAIFAEGGVPDRLRVDNGAPRGSWNDLPPDLALWLIGLGVGRIWNRPRHCQANGHVERAHGVLQQWSEPERCPDAATLQQRLDALSERQREQLIGRHGQRRSDAYPTLGAGGRSYDPAREAADWERQRVWRFLAARHWRRRGDKVGRISLSNRARPVGRRYAGQEVAIGFDPRQGVWIVRDDAGQVLGQPPAPELRQASILALEVTRQRIRTPPHPRPNPTAASQA